MDLCLEFCKKRGIIKKTVFKQLRKTVINYMYLLYPPETQLWSFCLCSVHYISLRPHMSQLYAWMSCTEHIQGFIEMLNVW